MKNTRLGSALPLLLLLALLPGCGEEEPDLFFKPEAAEAVAKRFLSAWVDGDTQAMLDDAAAPFLWHKEVWETREELERALPLKTEDLAGIVARTESLEVFTEPDLEAGRWPRGAKVPEGERAARMKKLGIRDEGFLLRGEGDGRTLFRLVVNPRGTTLAVQAFYP